MRISSILMSVSACFGLVCLAVAGSDEIEHHDDNDLHGKRHGCLTDHEVGVLRRRYINFFTNFHPGIARKSVTDDFHLYSESTHYVTPGFNISNAADPVYSSKKEFIAGQSSVKNPGVTPEELFTIVASDHGCNSFTFRWTQNVKPPLAGIDLVFIRPQTFLIETAYSEFNTEATLIGAGCNFVGGFCGTADCVKSGCGPAP